MLWSRRTITFGLAALLAAPAWAGSGFDAWLRGFRKRAAAQGLSPATLEAALTGIAPVGAALKLDRRQAEVARSLQDYLASAAGAGRIKTGKAQMRRHATLLGKIERKYRVEAQVITAIWGMESSFGGFRGNQKVIPVLATLAHDGRRAELFESELIAALRILEAGDVTAARMVGSLAGAMGHTQFMPSSFLDSAVDFTGDGRRDIWSDDPSDALASTASYLRENGWSHGQPWAVEVQLPERFDPALTGRIYTRSAREWSKLGLRQADGGSLANHGPGAVILPAGPSGPAFLVYGNFHVIKTYNYADSYAIGVGHLSDRLAGGARIRSSFPKDPWGMTLKQRQDLQRRLNAAGFNAGNPDGVIGEKGRAAIRAFEASRGLHETGVPSVALLDALR